MSNRTITIEIAIVGLIRDGVDSWICNIEIGGKPAWSDVCLRGATEDEAIEDAKRRISVVKFDAGRAS